MMQQYLEVRESLPPNTLLLFRLGDFYEMFDEDAMLGARILGITQTQRNGQAMAGIPYHAADNYIQKALKAGMKVAICEQMEPAKPGQLVKRSLSRILTPGTTLEDHQIEAGRNRFLLSFVTDKTGIHAAWLDLTTGFFQVSTQSDGKTLLDHFFSLDPSEIVLPDDEEGDENSRNFPPELLEEKSRLLEGRSTSYLPGFRFDNREGARTVRERLGVLNLAGFGIEEKHPALGCAGALIQYATENLCAEPENISRISEFRAGESLRMDPATVRSLEIFRSASGLRKGSLYEAMDATVTPPGARLLEMFLTAPSLDTEELYRRQKCVGEFVEAPGYASELREYLREVRDLPRILGRLKNRLRNPREITAIRDTILQLPLLIQVLDQFDQSALETISRRIQTFPDLCDLLQRSLVESPPNQLLEGGYIVDGYDPELDRLRSLNRDSRQWLADLESAEIKRSGIRNLKIKYNNAFGYFIEVTKSNLSMVPDDYIRKQTMINAERYYTPELKEKEKEILHADEKAISREEALFRDIVAAVLDQADALEETALAMAELDVIQGWSKLAREWNYCCPQLDNGDQLEIVHGRHPVVEQTMRAQKLEGERGAHDFVPNNTQLKASGEQIAVITGPNMAGKSTYIRQVALITLMAQTGSWVPAESCRIGLVDRIFSRVGASDELARGNSTFMVEMNETANILNNSTHRSLIILDEIGRGTSTYDGLSIAWAVVEHLHGKSDKGPRTLFATHYHELTQLERQLKRVRNYCVAVKEWNDSIIFVRQVVRGGADRSYGIHVARLAGLPESVIRRAQVILEKLESDESSHNLLRKSMHKAKADPESAEEDQLELFG